MTTEELKIIITADTQEAINKIKTVKNDLTDLSETATGKVDLGASFSAGTSAAQQLSDQISKLKSASFMGLVSSIANWRSSTKSAAAANQAAMTASKARIQELQREYKELIRLVKEYKNQNSDVYKIDGEDWEGPEEANKKSGWAFNEAQSVQKELNAETAKYNSLVAKAGKTGKGAFMGLTGAAATAAAAVAGVVALLATFVAGMAAAAAASKRLNASFLEAQKIGMSNASYEEWGYIMGQVGVEVDKLSDFIKGLSAAQNDLRDGSEDMVKAFKELGLSAEEAASMTQEELFTETVTRLQQVEDQVKRTGLAYRIFGEDDAAQLTNILNLNNEEMERMINNFYLLGGSASDSAIQKSRELQASISNMKLAWQGLTNTLGEAFMPMLNAVVRGLTYCIAAVNMFIRAMLGYDIVAKGSKNMENAAKSTASYGAALESASGAAEKLRRTTQGFDELNIVTDPNKSAGGGSGYDFGGGGASLDIPDMSAITDAVDLEGMANFFEKAKDIIRNFMPWVMVIVGILLIIFGGPAGMIAGIALAGLGIAAGIESGAWIEQFKALWNGIKNIASKIGPFFKKMLEGIKKTFTTVCNAIAKFLKNTWNGILKVIKTVWNAIAKFFKDLWNDIKKVATTAWNAIEKFFKDCWNGIKKVCTTVWEAIAKFFKNLWDDIKKVATTAWNAIEKFFKDCWNGIKSTATTIWNAISKFFTDTWNGIKTTATTIWNAISKFFTDTWNAIKNAATTAWNNIKTMLENTWNAIKTAASTLCENVKNFFTNAWNAIKAVWDVVKGYFQSIWDAIKSGASTLTDNVKNFFSNAWTAIKTVWDVVKGYFQGIWDDIKNKASAALESVKGFFSSAWTGIKNTWSGVTNWFGDIWTGIKNKFSSVGTWFGDTFGGAVTKIKNAWNGIKDWFAEKWAGIKGVFTSAGSAISDGITGALKSTFNNFMSGAVGLINKFINAINGAIDLINKIPGVSIGKLSTLRVPQLATGGIVTADTLARIGEGGKKEAVLPLEQNTGWMDMLADRLAARIGGGGQKVVLMVNERELGYATIDSINNITKQTGGLQLHIV